MSTAGRVSSKGVLVDPDDCVPQGFRTTFRDLRKALDYGIAIHEQAVFSGKRGLLTPLRFAACWIPTTIAGH
jgi:hypothetical protein